MKFLRNYGASIAISALVAVLATTLAVRSAGLFPNFPIYGAASYCAGGVSPVAQPSPAGAGINQAGATPCNVTVPAGPTTLTGTEIAVVDIVPGNATQNTVPETMSISLLALGGTGPTVTNTVAGAAQIPNNTPNWVENVGNTSATFTAPTAPQGGQIQRVIIQTAQTTSWVFGAAAGQSCIPACPFSNTNVAAGSVSAWQWYPNISTWVKVQ